MPIVHFARQDHFAHGVDPITLEKHVFSPAKTNAAGAERHRIFHLLWRIGVGPHTHAGDFGAPIHQPIEIAIGLRLLRDLVAMEQPLNDFRWGVPQSICVNRSARPVDRKVIVAFAEHGAVHRHRFRAVIDVQRRGTANTYLAHLPCDQRRVRADTATRGQNPFSRDHAAQILR